MALNKPRASNRIEPFTSQPAETSIITITDPEKAILASLEQLCSLNYADEVLSEKHLIRDKKTRTAIARDLSVYIQQALEFYRAAENARATTAPVFYYYAFLNLAKALSGIKYPRFGKRSENYHHGISWKPDKKFYADIWWNKVRLTGRGVWHTLFEAITGYDCP
ncbi:MAG: hypothetical protein ISS89_05700, partial [Candidatus Omnitrophica bacterium]|nr:hypothetical protein [Candidatus Omnitrophota bacterium]